PEARAALPEPERQAAAVAGRSGRSAVGAREKGRKMSPDDKLEELGLALPTVPTPIANYVPFKRAGDVAYLSGQGPRKPDGSYHTGKVGRDVTWEEAYQHARITALGLLAAARMAAGSLD